MQCFVTRFLLFLNSHQGYFGKKGIRVFHKQNNWHWAPVINTDSLWGLLPDGTATKAGKGKAPVIDVTKSVSKVLISYSNSIFIKDYKKLQIIFN